MLTTLARAYERSIAGRTGQALRFCRVSFPDLIEDAGCRDGDSLELARAALNELAGAGIVRLRHPRRDQSIIVAVEIDPSREDELFGFLERISPTGRREQLAAIFTQVANAQVPKRWQANWQQMCRRFADAAQGGRAMAPFSRADPNFTAELLRVTLELLHWNRESLLRFASCQLFGNSKQLEQSRSALETALSIVTEGEIHDVVQLGILENPRSCIVAGPILIQFRDGAADLRSLAGPITLSLIDVRNAVRIDTPSARFCIIENPTTFHELAKTRSDTLFACSDGYAKPALCEFMKRLDPELAMYHFGDSDPAGFDILRHLRAETGRTIGSIHMRFRAARAAEPLTPGDVILAERLLGSAELSEDEISVVREMLARSDKGDFEQERLGVPCIQHWPFY